MLLRYAAEHGYTVQEVYIDEDYSGADRRRPAFNQMLAAAERREFDVILAKTQSRFTRDMELVEKYLHGKFAEWGIRFIAVVDHVDTQDRAGKKARQINGLINEWYLEDLSDNVRSVLTHKRWQGDYIATFALYGYRKDPADHSRLLPDPEAAAVVRHIFALYLQGYGTARIAHILNAEGVPPPSVYRQQHGGPAHTDSEEFDGAVELRTVDEDQLVLTVRLASTSANSTGWTRLGVVASRQVQAKIGPDVLLADTNYRLSKALYLLN